MNAFEAREWLNALDEVGPIDQFIVLWYQVLGCTKLEE